MHANARRIELGTATPPSMTPVLTADVGLASATGLVRRIDERVSGVTVLLVSADLLAIAVALVVTRSVTLPQVWAALGLLVVCRATARVYRSRLRLSWFDDIPRELVALAVTAGAFQFGVVLLGIAPDLLHVVAALTVTSVVGATGRAVAFHAARVGRTRYGRGDRTLVVGVGQAAVELTEAMIDHPAFGLRPVAMLRVGDTTAQSPVPVLEIEGPLVPAVTHMRAATVVFACPDVAEGDSLDAAILARRMGCTVLLLPQMSELYGDGDGVERLRSHPLVRLAPDPTRRPTWWIKRALDSAMALIGLVLVAPLLLVAGVAVLIESGRPIFFSQQRIGLDGHPFTLYKLRSLRPANDTEHQTVWSVAADPRIGPVGRMLRRTSLDELPQLWNIAIGDMSLVGPRPERPTFVAKFSQDHDRYAARHRVPTGLTGLAQVNGLRGDTSIADRVRHDNYYIANWSLWLDLRILLLTVREVVRTGRH
ncbi:exopolysaccharide biosynthesis polyprenyl glycosylphosphotransferase [Pseudonocardia endophytica]|uniref:Exopolysaccharide biosynthesis polyprenyl glycosylphosphotransferase n=1 Tax=Pseudonocardia endophytica TaxID=401976 RepID=A0A4V2PHI6_PSEEN|nr:exopolysaccharide biosynthesis polyprenyl glycosylphosphotransferase [Pseudonocardia endophytica]TCK20896.1 exopolysaccharide biosynthesis polyprenyl glycosylphosphotransferase [Pseudonocardia endophytica]